MGVAAYSFQRCMGELRCGKTQLCHTMCVTTHLPRDMGDVGGKGVPPKRRGVMVGCVCRRVWVGAGTFRPERIESVAARYGVDGKPVLVHPPLNASSRSRKMSHAQSLVIGIRPCTLRLYLRLQALCWQSLLFTLLIPHPTIRPTTPYASLTLPRTVQLCQQGLSPLQIAQFLGFCLTQDL